MSAGNLAQQIESDTVTGFEEGTHHAVPLVDFDFAALDPVEDKQDAGGYREVLKVAFGLLMSPAPAPIAAARVALIYSLFNPGLRPVDVVRLFHGVRRDDLKEARLELAALLTPDEKKTATAPTGTVSEKSNPTMYEDGGSDAG